MRKLLAACVLLTLLGALAACAARAPEMTVGQAATRADAPAAAPAPAADGGPSTQQEAAVAGAPDDTSRMIVRTVDMSLVVGDAGQVVQTITKLAADSGGYVADSSQWRDGEQLRARMTVRIPAVGLDNALAALHGLAVRVESENVTGQDVTEEFTDLNAQLTNLEATEAQLRELLAEVRQKTQKAEDVLQVYRELTTIRGEIERVKGRMQYLNNVTAMATLKIELIPDLLAKPVVEPGWRPLETLRNASRASLNGMKGAVDALIWFVVYTLPQIVIILIPIALVVLFLRWVIRKLRGPARPKALKPEGAEQ